MKKTRGSNTSVCSTPFDKSVPESKWVFAFIKVPHEIKVFSFYITIGGVCILCVCMCMCVCVCVCVCHS